MSCERWEPDIALWVEGDLASDELERHLAGCAGCRQFADELRESQSALHSLAEAEIPSTRVRAYVLSEIERRRKTRWIWWAIPSAAALASLLLLLPGPAPEPEKIQVAVWKAPAPELHRSLTVAAQSRALPRRDRKGAAAVETNFIRMETDDDNVVILWIAENEGEMP